MGKELQIWDVRSCFVLLVRRRSWLVVKVYGCMPSEDGNLRDGITVATFIMKSGQSIEGEESEFPIF